MKDSITTNHLYDLFTGAGQIKNVKVYVFLVIFIFDLVFFLPLKIVIDKTTAVVRLAFNEFGTAK